MRPAHFWTMLIMSQWAASCQNTTQAAVPAPSIPVKGLSASALVDAAASHAAVVYSANGTAALVVSSADGLAASDCRNLGAVLGNMDTSFLGSMHTALVGPVSVAYRRFGPIDSLRDVQPPLIMVIGIACTMSDWTPRLLRALAAHREVIIYDSAGIGQSTMEAGWSIGPADYFKFQGDTLAGLITALQLDVAPDVLGWSLGAKIVLHLGVYHSSAFGKMVADAGSAGGPNSSTAVIDAVGQGVPVVDRLMKLKALLQTPSDTAAVCQWILEKQTMPQDDITAEEVRTQVEAEVEYHKAQNSIVAILPRIKNPTLVITSSNDLTNPPSNEVDVVAGIPGAVLVTFQGCGHLTPFQEVDKFVSLVNTFLAAQGGFQPQPQNSSAYRCQGIGLPDKTTG